MVNHGVSTGMLFLLFGVIYDRRHTRQLDEFGGLAKPMPVYAALFVIATLASVGLPGTNGFVGEFMVITGTFASHHARPLQRRPGGGRGDRRHPRRHLHADGRAEDVLRARHQARRTST